MDGTTLHKLKVVIEAQSDKAQKSMEEFKRIVEGTGKAADSNTNKISDGYKKSSDQLKSMSDQIGKIKTIATKPIADFKFNTDTAKKDISNITGMVGNMTELIRNSLNNIKFGDTGLGDRLSSISSSIDFSSIKNGFDDAFGSASDNIQDIVNSAKEFSSTNVNSQQYKQLEVNLREAKEALSQLQSEKNRLSQSGGYVQEETDEYKELIKQIDNADKRLEKLLDRQEKMNSVGVKTNSSQYKNLQHDIELVNNELAHLRSEKEYMKANGEAYITSETKAWRENEEAIARVVEQIRIYKNEMATMAANGATTDNASSGYDNGAQSTSYRKGMEDIGKSANSVKRIINEVIRLIPGIGTVAAKAGSIASKAFSGMKSVLNTVGASIKRASGLFAALIQKLTTTQGQSGKTGNSFNKLKNASNNLGKSVLSLGNMFKMMLIRMAIRGVINGAKEGFQNLAQYSDSTNGSISELMSALNQLKNSFAAAFAPILDVVVPILSTLIGYITKAVNAIGQLFAALTGKSSFISAKKVQTDYAASLNNSAGSASKAKKATDEYKKSIMGFDQINKRDSQNDSSGSSGGGGGGGAGSLFEDIPIASQFTDLANKIKEAWKNADFTEIGAMVGEKINDALNSIDWNKIQATLDKVAKSIATFLNGFIAATDWGLVGNTFSQGINTVFRTANTFAENFDWGNLGSAIGTGINGALNGLDWGAIRGSITNIVSGAINTLNTAIKTTDWSLVGYSFAERINVVIDFWYTALTEFDWIGAGRSLATALTSCVKNVEWKKAGKAISDGAKGALGFLKTAIGEFDWKGLGSSIKDFLISIDWVGIIRDLAFVIGQAIGGLAVMLFEVIGDCVRSIADFFSQKFEQCGGDIIAGLLLGIIEGVVNIAVWLYDNLVAPIIDGVKSMFGVHSPSTVFAEIGEFLILGLIEGIKSLIGAVISVFTFILDGIKGVFSSIGEWFGEKFSDAVTFISDAWSGVVGFFSGIWGGISNTFNSVGGWFGEKFTSAYTNVRNAFSNAGSFFGSVWNNITGAFGNISGWFHDKFSAAWTAVKNVFSSGGAVFDGIKDGILNGLKAVINALISGINKVVSIPFNGINSALSSMRSLSILGVKPFGWMPTISVPKIPMLANGGMLNAGQLFIANEAGPELIGSYGNKSAVMNSGQIVESVSAGVSEGVFEAVMAAFAMNKSEGAAPVLEFVFQCGSEVMYRIVKKGEKTGNNKYRVKGSLT